MRYRKTCTQCGCPFHINDGEEWKKICLNCWTNNKYQQRTNYSRQSQPQQNIGIEPDMLRILVMLCHPDKHNNSAASNKATTYLLSLRK